MPSRENRNTPSLFILQKPEIRAGTGEPLAFPVLIGVEFAAV